MQTLEAPITGTATPPAVGRLLYTIEDAADQLSVSVTSIRKFINDGRLRRVPNFRHVLISAQELQRFAATLE
jgi:excisionase family DNA binding protein